MSLLLMLEFQTLVKIEWLVLYFLDTRTHTGLYITNTVKSSLLTRFKGSDTLFLGYNYNLYLPLSALVNY